MDLSKAVDYAAAKNEPNERVHIVQADISHPAFRDGVFDLIYSTGVLHHLPDPAGGFQKLSKKVAPGGKIAAWVYGLQGMNPSCRLSHLTFLGGLGPRLPRSVSLSVSWGLATVAEVASRLTGRGRLPGVRRWVPEQLRDFALLPFRLKAKEFYNRIAAPVTYFLDREKLRGWILSAGLTEVDISPTKGRGWCARALRT